MPAIPPYVNGAAPGISAERLNQPFHVTGAQYDAGNARIRVTIGAGRADFGVQDGVYEQLGSSTYDIPDPVVNTTYHVYVTAAGFTHSVNNPVGGAGARLAVLEVGAALGDPVVTDVRGMIPVKIEGGGSPFLLMGA